MMKPFIFVLLLGIPIRVLPQKINAITSNRTALLGSSYQSEKELFVGQQCVTGDKAYTGIAQSTFNFTQSLSSKEASDQLGFAIGGRARFGAVEASAAARFMKSSVSSSFSISSVWMSEYILPTEKLINVSYSTIGNGLHNNYERWAETCGDMYVDEIVKGAKLFFSIRVDFSTQEAKQSFEAQFQLTGPLYSANASLQKASQEFSKEAKITISAFQIGGDVSKLTEVFGNSDTSTVKFVKCSLGSFQDCAGVIQSAINYASNTNTGFPSQLKVGAQPGAAPLYYNIAKYSAAGIYINNYPGLEIAVKRSRAQLSSLFEKQLELSITAERLLELGLDNQTRAKIITEKKTIESNISKILAASEICYNNPNECKNTVDALSLSQVNETILELPPPPIASFRLSTITKNIWNRGESLDTMNKSTHSNIMLYGEDLSYLKIKSGDAASVILYVEGKALNRAEVFFENIKLTDFSLKAENILFPDKKTKSSVSIVLESTRQLPGWVDINIDDLADSLKSKGLKSGKGIFYLIITDEFNRKTRFDLYYGEWEYTETKDGDEINEHEWLVYFRNWWDKKSDGTNSTIRNEWTRKSLLTDHKYRPVEKTN